MFAKQVPDPERFGVIEFDQRGQVISIEEKPTRPRSNFAQTGFYIFDNRVVNFAKKLKPSKRGELEIVDLVNIYFKKGELKAEKVEGEWIDAGTFESLFRASTIAREHQLGMKLPTMAVEVVNHSPLQTLHLTYWRCVLPRVRILYSFLWVSA